MKPILAITMGDPAGVGPEIAVKTLSNEVLCARFHPLIVGSMAVMQEAAERIPGAPCPVAGQSAVADVDPGCFPVLQPEGLASSYPKGQVDRTCGDAAFRCIERAIQLALDGEVAAVVTNPLHKEALQLAGHKYEGHTEIFRDLTSAPTSAMMLVGDGLHVVHVSTHCSLGEAVRRCRTDRILEVTELTNATMKRLGVARPRLGMAALNPHAGEGGIFGDEERTQILPACEVARAKGIDVSDPLPADTIFSLARGGRFDAIVVQYHDQGHIPVKLLGFHYDHSQGKWSSVSGINVTLGLPILRVSVDHGTAFDQAWKGQASADSLENAIDFALRYVAGPESR